MLSTSSAPPATASAVGCSCQMSSHTDSATRKPSISTTQALSPGTK